MKRRRASKTVRPTVSKEAPQTDFGTWLTRAEAAEFVGVSVNTIINWHESKLHGVQVIRRDRGGSERRQWVYDPEELAKNRRPLLAMRSREPGETAARAFELFGEGKSNAEVVIALREVPDEVAALRAKWLDFGGADLVINPAARQAFEELVGSFTSVVELVKLVTELKRTSH